MKTIGQFAKENKVTVKTLHHYEKMDLIKPSSVDEESGYRYYKEEQSLDLSIVLFMKELGFSLSEIRDVIQNQYDKDSLLEFVLFKKKQASQDIEATSNRLFRLDKMKSILENHEDKIPLKELIRMSKEELFTGMYGRGKFIEAAEKAFHQAKQEDHPLCVIQMDLDHFHQVNKNYGYEIGDLVLKRTQDEIVSVLQESKYETLMERKGGDEFTVLAHCSALQVSQLTTKILNRVVAIDYSDVAEDLKVSITAGMAALRKRTKSYADLLHEATIKLYEGKRNRK